MDLTLLILHHHRRVFIMRQVGEEDNLGGDSRADADEPEADTFRILSDIPGQSRAGDSRKLSKALKALGLGGGVATGLESKAASRRDLLSGEESFARRGGGEAQEAAAAVPVGELEELVCSLKEALGRQERQQVAMEARMQHLQDMMERMLQASSGPSSQPKQQRQEQVVVKADSSSAPRQKALEAGSNGSVLQAPVEMSWREEAQPDLGPSKNLK